MAFFNFLFAHKHYIEYLNDVFGWCIWVAALVIMLLITASFVRKKYLRFPLLMSWIVFVVFVVSAFLCIEYTHFQNHVKKQIDLQATAKVFASSMHGGIHASIKDASSRHTPEVDRLFKNIEELVEMLPEVAAAYTLRRSDDWKWSFIVCPGNVMKDKGQQESEEKEIPIGTTYSVNNMVVADFDRAMQGQSVFIGQAVHDDFGSWIIAVEPIYDTFDRVEAILAIDFWASSWERDAINAKRIPQIISSILLGFFFTGISLLLARIHTTECLKVSTDALEKTLKKQEQAQREAVCALHERNLFMTSMSHEVRTPITSILGYTEIIDDAGISDDERFNSAKTLHHNTEHLLSVLNDILEFSKVDSGKIKVEPQFIPVMPLLEELVRATTVKCRKTQLFCVLSCATAIPTMIRTDRNTLKHVLQNLTDNAVKFTPNGGVAITLSWEDSADSSKKGRRKSRYGNFCIDIHDTGIGMSQETIKTLFTPFCQAESAMTRRYGGTGLGLSIARGLTTILGGTIHVRSEEGRGTTFTLVLPQKFSNPIEWCNDLPVDADESESCSASAIISTPSPLADCDVLLAEDSPDSQRLFQTILTKAGATVTLASNGAEMIEKAKSAWNQGHPFDVILVDMQMPIVNGYEAVRTLRENSYGGIIIALTANTLPAEVQRCYEVGCDDYATKPIRRETLIKVVYKNTQRSSQMKTPTAN